MTYEGQAWGWDYNERTSQLPNISLQSHLQAMCCSILRMHGVHDIFFIMSLLELSSAQDMMSQAGFKKAPCVIKL